MPRDRVADYLRERGCSEWVVAGGLEGLLSDWERIAESVAAGYPLTLDDYLNDLDVRELVAGVLDTLPPEGRSPARERVAAADARMRASTEQGECVWGAEVAADEGWTPETHWWYYAWPRNPGADFS